MAVQKFTLEAIQKVRNAIQAELAVGNTTDQPSLWSEPGADLPEPSSLEDLSSVFTFGGRSEEEQAALALQDQWQVSTFNPAVVLLKLPGLWLKPEYRLVSYLYRAAEGSGLIFALPEALSTTAHLQSALPQTPISPQRERRSIVQLPQPQGALPHFMAAIGGDRSTTSFMLASLLRRELEEFGAMGKRQTWQHHRLIQSLPHKLPWQGHTEIPKNWLPKAIVTPEGQAAVEFFSCQIDAQAVVLYRHLDRYSAGGYQARVGDQGLAVVRRSGG